MGNDPYKNRRYGVNSTVNILRQTLIEQGEVISEGASGPRGISLKQRISDLRKLGLSITAHEVTIWVLDGRRKTFPTQFPDFLVPDGSSEAS